MLKKMQQLQKFVVCLILVILLTFSSFRPAFASSNYPSSEAAIAAVGASTESYVTGSEFVKRCTNKKFILTNLTSEMLDDSVLSKFNPKSGFSGVYNIHTKKWMALPSQDASLKNDLEKDDKVAFEDCVVKRQGGHSQVREEFFNKVKEIKKDDLAETINPENNLGFFVDIISNSDEDKTLGIKWTSGKINCCYYNSRGEKPLYPTQVPIGHIREEIQKVISRTTNYKVEDKNEINDKACKDEDLNECRIPG